MPEPREYQGEIRDSQINTLLEKVQRRNYGRYLVSLRLVRVRGFTDRPISFDFPVTAIVGPNGGGKTTVLGAAACAYKEIKPRQFFAKSGKFDDSMTDWRIEYELIDRSVNPNGAVRRTAAFHRQKWAREAEVRDVLVFGVARTVPANERKELQRCVSSRFSVPAERIRDLGDAVCAAVEKILGKDIRQFTHIRVDTKGRVSLLAGATEDGTRYSEFHFGAGESSVIRMVMQIEAAPENTLILIEEIENGLHPVATMRMVEYLIEVAERKKAQAIFTTHSNDALKPLPSKAIWSAIGGRLFQGKLDIASLRAITGQVAAEIAVFVEDEFAAAWVRAMLRSSGLVGLDAVEVHPMQGDGIAVQVNKYHNVSPARRFPSICIIDGDSEQEPSDTHRVYRLPGQSPEAYVFDTVMEKSSEAMGTLAVRLLKRYEDHAEIERQLREIRRLNRDPHLLAAQIGKALGFVPESTVRDAFVTVWTEAYPEESARLLRPVAEVIKREEPVAL